MSIPQSTINVCSNVRLNSRYEHSIYFADRTAQLNYFAGKVVKTFSAYSFIRKTWDLNVAASMEEAATWSYLYFTNTANGKRYFYFIDNIEYVNDGTVRLKLQIDVLQTYLFDDSVELLECFVEREHTESDDAGLHTVDEGLETGELFDAAVYDWDALNDHCLLCLASFNPNYVDVDKPVQALSGNYNGVFSGLKVWAVAKSDWNDLGDQLDKLDEKGFADGILAMWIYPKALVQLGGENTWTDDDLFKTVDGAKVGHLSFTKLYRPVTFNGYTPKNNKLYTFPYSFIYATNNNGGAATYRWERFNYEGNYHFLLTGCLSAEGEVKMYPESYNGLKTVDNDGQLIIKPNYEEGLTIGGFPTCAWDSDVYKMWLAQNHNQHQTAQIFGGVGVAAGALSAGASLFKGDFFGAGMNAVGAIQSAQQIADVVAQKKDMSIQPPQAKGSFSSNVNITVGKQTFSFYVKTVTAERARIIDDYFTMYGYKVSRVKKPNIHARKSHTYIKTIGCHIEANLCNEDATKIESIFDHGVTFWTNGDRIGRYTDDNSPL